MRRADRSTWIALFVALAVVLVTLALLPGSSPQAFPQIDRSRLRLTLERSGCFGDCPAYRVTIDGEGHVLFTTDRSGDGLSAEYEPPGVVVAGTYRTRVDRREVDRLVEHFRKVGFFGLRDAYHAPSTDLATHVVTIDTGNGKKTVVDYGGVSVGMPRAVKQLQHEIDRVAGTAVWIEGLPAAIPQLVAEGAHFNGRLGALMMTAAIARNDVPTMAKLGKLGAPLRSSELYAPLAVAARNRDIAALDWLLANGAGSTPGAMADALAVAVDHDNMATFARLRAAGALDRLDIASRTRLLGSAAQRGNEALVDLLLARGVHINGNARTRAPEDPPLFLAAQGDLDGKSPVAARRRIVRRLLDAGARADWTDPVYPASALFLVDDAPIAKMLVDAGADPNFRDDYDGEPIIFSISDEGVALVMIDAGLDLKSVRPGDRMTLRGWAVHEKWPRVLAILDRRNL